MVAHILAVFVLVFGLQLDSAAMVCRNSITLEHTLGIGENLTFTSPNYPSPYPGNKDYRLKVSSPENSYMTLDCPVFDVLMGKTKCIDLFYFSGIVNLENGLSEPYCGDFIRTFLTNHLEVFFSPIQTSHNSSKGFECVVQVFEKISYGCGQKDMKSRIVDGVEAQINEWPWQVALQIQKLKGLMGCGGSLISPNWVLTAAHCVDGASEIVAILGEHDIEVQRVITKKIIHSGYIGPGKGNSIINDIAVLLLSHPIEYSHGIVPICLPTNLRTKTFDGENAILTGWGNTAFNESASNNLLEVTLPVITNSECAQFGNLHGRDIWADHICTYREGSSPCHGDSGGPLVWQDDEGRYQLIGIVSGAFDGICAAENNPAIYARVTSYIDWIQENIDSLCSRP